MYLLIMSLQANRPRLGAGRGSASTAFTEVNSAYCPKTSHTRSSRASADIPHDRRAIDRNPRFSRDCACFFHAAWHRAAVRLQTPINFLRLFAPVGASRTPNASRANFRYRPDGGDWFDSGVTDPRFEPDNSPQDQPSPASFRRRENQPDKAGLMAPPTYTSDEATFVFASVTSTPIW
jgi:hypothetical protein